MENWKCPSEASVTLTLIRDGKHDQKSHYIEDLFTYFS